MRFEDLVRLRHVDHRPIIIGWLARHCYAAIFSAPRPQQPGQKGDALFRFCSAVLSLIYPLGRAILSSLPFNQQHSSKY